MTTDLVPTAPLLPMDPAAARAAMDQFQALTAAMLTDTDWQRIPAGQFVKRSGWQKISTGYRLRCEVLEEEVLERDEKGEPVRARAKVRVTAPDGAYWDGTGRCSTTERGFSKPEHDVTSTAVTRATNRAISNLVGFGQVSAEELDAPSNGAAAGASPPAAPWGPVANDEQEAAAAAAVKRLAADVDAEAFVLKIGVAFDGVPVAAVKALTGLAKYVEAARAAAVTDDAPRQPTPDEVYPPGRYQGD